MSRFTIIECSIDVDNYVTLNLIDEHNNVQCIQIRTSSRDDDIRIVHIENDEDINDNSFEFHMHRMTREQFDALIT